MRHSWTCGDRAFTDDGDGFIRVWDAATFRYIGRISW